MPAESLRAGHRDAALLGQSAATCRLRADILRAAPFASNVLITGPSGTGKELVARELHARSPRADGPFIPVDCASMAGELMASQLFGHTAGAFTGANCAALGCFRAAHGGTIFLDEIGELEYPLQAKLLRVIQERAVTPVGSYQCERVDVRVVAATNRHLQGEVLAGRFREDLFYRLNVVLLRTTALAERSADTAELAEAFLEQFAAEGLPRCTLAPCAVEALAGADWPGNVRQLRNVLEQAAIECEGSTIWGWSVRAILAIAAGEGPQQWENPPAAVAEPAGFGAAGGCVAGVDPALVEPWQTLASVERRHLVRTLEHTFYNRAAAARLLGMSRQALLRRMKAHGISTPGETQR